MTGTSGMISSSSYPKVSLVPVVPGSCPPTTSLAELATILRRNFSSKQFDSMYRWTQVKNLLETEIKKVRWHIISFSSVSVSRICCTGSQ